MLLFLVVLLGCWSVPSVLAAPVQQAGVVTVSVDPADIAAQAGDRFEINIAISGVQDLGAFELSLRYDPALVQVDKATLGKFIGSTDRTLIPLGPTVDPTAGQVVVGVLTIGTQPGAQGQGVLLTLACTALRAGQGQFSLAAVRLSDTTGKPIAATSVDGKVTFTGDVVVPTATRAPATPTATLAPASATAPAPPTLEATATAAPNGTTAPASSPTAAATAAPNGTTAPASSPTAAATAPPNGTTAPAPSPTVAATPIPRATVIAAATATAQVRRTAEAVLTASSVAAGTPEPTTIAMQATATPASTSAPGSVETPSMSPATPQTPSAATPEAPATGAGAALAIGLGVVAVGLGAGGVYLWRRGRQKNS